MARTNAAFTGGKLNLKGDGGKTKSSKKKSKKSKHRSRRHGDDGERPSSPKLKRNERGSGDRDEVDGSNDQDFERKPGYADEGSDGKKRAASHGDHDESDDVEEDEDLTEAEKRSRKFTSRKNEKDMKELVSMSHRERVEKFNEKLGELTEHNDIPRVSAAGNG